MKAETVSVSFGFTNFRCILIYSPLVLLMLTWVLFVQYDKRNQLLPYSMIRADETSDNADTVLCQVPVLDPFDKSILEFVEHPRSTACLQVQENVTYIDMNGYLRINESGVSNLKLHNISFSCFYRTLDREPVVSDSRIKYSEDKQLTEPVKPDDDIVDVTCRDSESYEFYRNFHAHPADKPDRIFAKPTDSQLSVLMLYIDSISYSVLQRNLPSTFNYTKNVMKINYFKGFNKIGDNTYPNMMAILSGKRVHDEQAGMMREVSEQDLKTQFDSWPLIWKFFAAKGYATMFNEDVPGQGLFHYTRPAFAKKPVDYYYHMYWVAMDWARHENSTVTCYGNNPHAQIWLDVVKRHLVYVNESLQFLYNFNSQLSHDYVNEVERFDDDLTTFWREMYEGGYLNKTIVVFGADHGSRYSAVRSTLIGLLEERMPFYGLWFPEWFYRLHPNIKENLQHNENLLTSSFDVYETLKDIYEANYDGVQRRPGSRGLSQLYPLPKNRTCRNAGIPDHFCTCSKETAIDKDGKLARDVCNFLVEHLNALLANNATDLCHTITLTKIHYVRLVDFDEKVKQGVKYYDWAREIEEKAMNKSLERTQFPKSYRVSVDTEPFGAKFEAIVRVSTVKETNATLMHVDGSVSRTNSYKGLSDCIHHAILQKYCSCKDVKTFLA